MKSRWLEISAVMFILALASCAKVEDSTGPEAQTEKATTGELDARLSKRVAGTKGKLAKHTAVVPQDVRNEWKSVVLAVKNKKTNKQEEVTINIGSSAVVGNLTIAVEAFLPDFDMDDEARNITSKSNEAINPAVNLTIKDSDGKTTSAWIFSKHAQTHPLQNEKFEITLKKFHKK